MVNNISPAELIAGIALKSGVKEPESKTFFEIFLILLSKKLQPGDRLYVEGTGYFHFRNAISRTPGSSVLRKDMKVILFSRELINNPSVKDHLMFNIPDTEEEEEFNPSDYHFSLSIGKPVIPVKGAEGDNFIFPPAGPELRSLLYSKAERLISGSEIQKRTDVNAPQILIPTADSVRSFHPEAPEINEFLKETPKPEQIENESGKASAEKPQPHKVFDDEKISGHPDIPEKIKKPEAFTVSDHYEQVKSVRKESPKPASPLKTESKGDFTRVSSITDDQINKDENRKREIKRDKERKEEQLNKPPAGKSTVDEDEIIEKGYKGRRYKAGIFVLGGLLILSAIAAVVYYSPLFKSGGKQQIMIAKGPAVQPVIIERTFEIPVNYPYDNSIIISAPAFNPVAIIPDKDTLIAEQNKPAVPEQEIKTQSPSASPVKIKDNIYRYDQDYVVQVSSWKSHNKAKSEVERFINMGYRSFLEEASLSGKGLYYRVRVGNFKSLEEAEGFLRKNI